MMKFHSDYNHITLCVESGGLSIAINNKHYHVKMHSGDLSDLGVLLIREAQKEYALEKEKENQSTSRT